MDNYFLLFNIFFLFNIKIILPLILNKFKISFGISNPICKFLKLLTSLLLEFIIEFDIVLLFISFIFPFFYFF
jgi:hypothetical protein